jgi:hypothetical protein
MPGAYPNSGLAKGGRPGPGLTGDYGSAERMTVMSQFFTHFLLILSAWTLLIKFLFPISYGLAHGPSWSMYIMWDFWWVVHIWLAWAFYAQPRCLYPLALAISVAEISIISFKFYGFFINPNWTIWAANWFINKIFVLSCFLLILAYLLRDRRKLWGGAEL